MSTEAYRIAQEVLRQLRQDCPKLVAPQNTKKNTLVFFQGTPHEKTVQIRRMLGKADAFWAPQDWEPMVRPWGRNAATPGWVLGTAHKMIDAQIRALNGDERTYEKATGASLARIMDAHIMQMVGKAESPDTLSFHKIRKMVFVRRPWGMTYIKQDAWIHRLFVANVKTCIPESAWKIACTNAGNFYSLNESVLADAIREERAYASLYGIHPLLGRAWAPWIRAFVEESLDEKVDYRHYADQLFCALHKKVGLNKSGMRTLHRIAEQGPKFLIKVMETLIDDGSMGYRYDVLAKDDRPNSRVSMRNRLVQGLNGLNGSARLLQKTPFRGQFSGIGYKQILEAGDRFDFPYSGMNIVLADAIVIAQMNFWLQRIPADLWVDGIQINDWMRSTATEHPQSLYRGYAAVIQGIKSAGKRKMAALQWANRSQRAWHQMIQERQQTQLQDNHGNMELADLPPWQQGYPSTSRQNLTWSSLPLPEIEKDKNAKGKPVSMIDEDHDGMEMMDDTSSLGHTRLVWVHPENDWQVFELLDSQALTVEGSAMQHCVSSYANVCANGQSHIFSVRDKRGMRVSTLELRIKGDPRNPKSPYGIAQHRGFRDHKINAQAEAVGKAFLTVVQEVTHRKKTKKRLPGCEASPALNAGVSCIVE